MEKKQQSLYVSPQMEIIELKSQTTICQNGSYNGSIDGLNLKDDDKDNWY